MRMLKLDLYSTLNKTLTCVHPCVPIGNIYIYVCVHMYSCVYTCSFMHIHNYVCIIIQNYINPSHHVNEWISEVLMPYTIENLSGILHWKKQDSNGMEKVHAFKRSRII
jgi:hypothetical protein